MDEPLIEWWEYIHNMFWACSFCVRTGKSMNKLLSNCGLVDSRIRVSEKDLPAAIIKNSKIEQLENNL